MQQAFDQGDIFLVQQGGATTVKVDLNGGSHSDLDNDFDVVKLDGVSVANLDAQRNDLFLA